MQSQISLMDEFRQAARRKVKRISAKERARIIDGVRIHSFSELLRQHIRSTSAIRCDDAAASDSDATTEMDDDDAKVILWLIRLSVPPG